MDRRAPIASSPTEALAKAFHDFATSFANTVTIPDAYRMAVQAARRMTSAGAGGFFLFDDEAQAYVLMASEGISEEVARALARVPVGGDVGVRLKAIGEPLAAAADFFGMESSADAERLRTLILFPVFHQGRVIGILWVAPPEESPFPEVQRCALEAVALQSGCLISRLRTVSELRSSEVKYRTIVRDAGEAILLTDLSGRVLEVNREAENLMGIAAEQLIGRDIRSLHAESCRSSADGYLRRLASTRMTSLYETSFARESGAKVSVEVLAALIEYEGRRVIKYNVRDISERRKIDLFKDTIVRSVTHKLKGPIAMARMAYDMIASADPNDAELRARSLKIMEQSLDRMTEDSDRILKYYRALLDQGEWDGQSSSLRMVIQRAVAERQALLAGKMISFDVRLTPEADAVLIGEVDCEVVIANLLDNAVKFTKEGTITVEDGVEGERIWIRIVDTGSGIPADVQQQVFERFYQGNPATSGVGLGLPLCKEIVERHGGSIRVTSEGTGKGTAVTVELPKA